MATCSIQRLWGAKNPSFFHIWPVCSKMSFHTTDCEKYPNSMRDSVQRRIHWVVLVIFSFWSGILIWRWWCASHGAEEAKFSLRGQADAFSFFCCLVPILKNFFFRSDFLALVGTTPGIATFCLTLKFETQELSARSSHYCVFHRWCRWEEKLQP